MDCRTEEEPDLIRAFDRLLLRIQTPVNEFRPESRQPVVPCQIFERDMNAPPSRDAFSLP